ncbi:hypothetical protein NQ318_018048, partial [Aromia moschata]
VPAPDGGIRNTMCHVPAAAEVSGFATPENSELPPSLLLRALAALRGVATPENKITLTNFASPCAAGESQKMCLLRTAYYDQQLWNYFAGFYCYNYTNSVRLTFKYNYTAYPVLCRGRQTSIPIAILNDSYAFFDYTNDTSMAYIRKSFKTDAVFYNFVNCCREAMNCCEYEMDETNIVHNTTHCPAVWDAWSCFPPTEVNTVARLTCSSQAYQSPDHVCRLESEKECNWNDTYELAIWKEQTDYSTCAIAPVYERRHTFHVIFLSICIFLCLPAIVIFFIFEKLRRITRVVLHRNLLIAICIRNVLTSLSKELVILDALKSDAESNHVMSKNTVGCRILASFECAAKNGIYACMLVDAYYLHKVIVRSFAKDPRIHYLYAIAAVLTFLPTLIWSISMGVTNSDNCWMVDSDGFQWINDGFRITILAINTLLLLDIIRVMLMKMKHGSTTRQTKYIYLYQIGYSLTPRQKKNMLAAFRATLFLIPLFGIHIMVTAKKLVYDDSCRAEDLYDFARYSMEALQGIFVAILFCYANTEVHNEISNGYRKSAIYLNQNFGWNIRREPNYNNRRATTATYVQGSTC